MTTTTAFQYVFDNAETLNYNRRAVTAQTQSRDGTVRTVSRGGQVWRFEVKLPDGPKWQDLRPIVESIETADRYTPALIQLNNSGYVGWLSGYRGSASTITGFAATWTQGANSITLTNNPTIPTGGFKFRRGDFIQLGAAGRVYTVIEDVPANSNTVKLHRPILDATVTNAVNLNVAQNCVFRVICTELPQWTIFARDQISWQGNFVFVEHML
jgi:hypothetical protein